MLNRDPIPVSVALRSHRGYVLIAVIAVLVLVITVLATLTRISLRRALAAADARVRFQQRVASQSIERVVLPKASGVFSFLQEQAEQERQRTGQNVPVPRLLRSAVTMSGVTYDVVIADEDAKLNLNQVYHLIGPERTQNVVSDMVGPAAARSLRMVPSTRPLTEALFDDRGSEDDPEVREIPRAFRSWGEVFDLASLVANFGDDAAVPNLTSEVTCWGGGALNLQRASDRAIQAAASCVLSDAGAKRLVRRYRESPTASAAILIHQEAGNERSRTRLRRMLSETSTHFSVWIDASAVGRRSLRTFSVMRLTDEGIMVNERFAF